MNKIDFSKVSPTTIGTAVAFFVVAINYVLTMFGLSPVPEDKIVEFVVAVASLFVMFLGFWKNQNWTTLAIDAQETLDAAKLEATMITQTDNGAHEGDPTEEVDQTPELDEE